MRERCYCGRCVPNALPRDPYRAVCSACGQEVRFGGTVGALSWQHRDPVDHFPVLGHLLTRADAEATEAGLDAPRTAEDGTTYTYREVQIAAIKDRKRREAAEKEAAGDDYDEEVHQIPPAEITSTPIDIGDSRLPGGCKSMLKLARKHGWTAWVTYARGPRVHGTTQALIEMSDNFVLRARLDGTDKACVASWWTKKGKPGFEHAYLVTIDRENQLLRTTPANSDGLKKWLKPPEPEPLPLESETL